MSKIPTDNAPSGPDGDGPSDPPKVIEIDPQPPKRRWWLAISGVVVALIVLFARSTAVFYTDLLWYKEVGYTDVFWRRISSQFSLALIFGVFVFIVIYVNLMIVARSRKAYAPASARRAGPEEEVLFRYREYAAPYYRWASAAVAGFFALTLGASARAAYRDWLLFNHSVPFGVSDPVFNLDNSFYVFRLGFLKFTTGRVFAVLMVTILVCIVAHYLEGGIRLANPAGKRVNTAVKVHLSILFALLAMLQAYIYWLQRYSLVFSERGVVTGASATDINATLPALNLLVVISVLVALMLVVNIWRKGWALPVVALGTWLIVQMIGVGIFPALYQRFFVQPQEFTKESEYIDRNIAGTRQAYALENVQLKSFVPSQTLTFNEAKAGGVADASRMWDPALANDAYNQLQALRGYYRFPDSDIDRYEIGGRRVQSVISSREIDRQRLPSKTWVNEHLQFTHGYGVVMSAATTAAEGGRPAFVVSDMPPSSPPEISATSPALAVSRPQIYFGEVPDPRSRFTDFVVVKTKEREFDYPRGSEAEVTTEYQGDGGIPMTGVMRKGAFALRFGDINPLISSQVTDESRLMYRLDIRDRVKSAMPFLDLDADPYPVIVDGKILWVQDAYTSSTRYPYSQKLDAVRVDRGVERIAERLPDQSELKDQPDANYVRNSVKAVVDAYTGKMTLYVVDPTDPVIKSYQKMFPSAFTPKEEAPPELVAHFRYAEDFFRVQSDMYRIYHVTDPRVFYNQEDKWQVPERNNRNAATVRKEPLVPYYTMLRAPGETEDSFVLVQPFTPLGKPNLLGYMTGDSDPKNYGTLTAHSFPKDKLLDGPETVTAKFNTDPDISRELTLLDQKGSRVRYASLLTLPISGDLIYVQPVFVVPEDVNLPTLQRVIVSHRNRVVMRECAVAAVADALAEPPNAVPTPCPLGAATPFAAVSTPGGTSPTPSTGAPAPPLTPGQSGASYQQAIQNAQRSYEEAQSALRSGNLALYQQKVDEMKRWIDEAQKAQSTA